MKKSFIQNQRAQKKENGKSALVKSSAPKLSEAVIENQILTWLFYQKIWAWKNITGGYFDAKRKVFRKQRSKFAINGASDIVGVFKGRPLFIECKALSGRLTPDQKAFLDRASKEGALAFVARNIGDVERELGLNPDAQKAGTP